MLSVILLSAIMLSINYAECRKLTHYAGCLYAECRKLTQYAGCLYAEWRYAEGRGATSKAEVDSIRKSY